MTRPRMTNVPVACDGSGPSGSMLIRVCATMLAAALVLGRAPSLQAQGGDTSRVTRTDSARPAPSDTSHAGSASAATDASGGAQPAQPRDTGGTGNLPADTVVQRVHALVAEGQTGAARTLVDSLLAATPATSSTYPSILYTRATLATNADSAENDYRRVIVEYAGSPEASDALLRLAQLELARGDRQQAAAHLARLTREQLPNQTGTSFARTQLQVGLAYFDLSDTARACAALTAASTAAPSTDVELRNRIDYNTRRCVSASSAVASNASSDSSRKAGAGAHAADSTTKTAGARGATSSTKASATKASTHAPSASGAAASSTTRRVRKPGYTIQVAAYQTKGAADALVEHLSARGFVARIYGTAAPYRVRVGRFATETQADSAAASLKRKGITGFVTPSETTE